MPKPNDIRFCKDRYEKYDGPAKLVATEFLQQRGFKKISENLDESRGKFKKIWDVAGTHSKKSIGEWRIEAEIKQDWGTKWFDVPFKFHTMDFPYRKRDKAEEHATHMMIIGGDYKRLFIVNREAMLGSPVENKWCRNRKGSEPFFKVDIQDPKAAFYFKNEKTGKWKQWKD